MGRARRCLGGILLRCISFLLKRRYAYALHLALTFAAALLLIVALARPGLATSMLIIDILTSGTAVTLRLHLQSLTLHDTQPHPQATSLSGFPWFTTDTLRAALRGSSASSDTTADSIAAALSPAQSLGRGVMTLHLISICLLSLTILLSIVKWVSGLLSYNAVKRSAKRALKTANDAVSDAVDALVDAQNKLEDARGNEESAELELKVSKAEEAHKAADEQRNLCEKNRNDLKRKHQKSGCTAVGYCVRLFSMLAWLVTTLMVAVEVAFAVFADRAVASLPFTNQVICQSTVGTGFCIVVSTAAVLSFFGFWCGLLSTHDLGQYSEEQTAGSEAGTEEKPDKIYRLSWVRLKTMHMSVYATSIMRFGVFALLSIALATWCWTLRPGTSMLNVFISSRSADPVVSSFSLTGYAVDAPSAVSDFSYLQYGKGLTADSEQLWAQAQIMNRITTTDTVESARRSTYLVRDILIGLVCWALTRFVLSLLLVSERRILAMADDENSERAVPPRRLAFWVGFADEQARLNFGLVAVEIYVYLSACMLLAVSGASNAFAWAESALAINQHLDVAASDIDTATLNVHARLSRYAFVHVTIAFLCTTFALELSLIAMPRLYRKWRGAKIGLVSFSDLIDNWRKSLKEKETIETLRSRVNTQSGIRAADMSFKREEISRRSPWRYIKKNLLARMRRAVRQDSVYWTISVQLPLLAAAGLGSIASQATPLDYLEIVRVVFPSGLGGNTTQQGHAYYLYKSCLLDGWGRHYQTCQTSGKFPFYGSDARTAIGFSSAAWWNRIPSLSTWASWVLLVICVVALTLFACRQIFTGRSRNIEASYNMTITAGSVLWYIGIAGVGAFLLTTSILNLVAQDDLIAGLKTSSVQSGSSPTPLDPTLTGFTATPTADTTFYLTSAPSSWSGLNVLISAGGTATVEISAAATLAGVSPGMPTSTKAGIGARTVSVGPVDMALRTSLPHVSTGIDTQTTLTRVRRNVKRASPTSQPTSTVTRGGGFRKLNISILVMVSIAMVAWLVDLGLWVCTLRKCGLFKAPKRSVTSRQKIDAASSREVRDDTGAVSPRGLDSSPS